jgi:glycosyltransferase involved in cell wall biosynthesis
MTAVLKTESAAQFESSAPSVMYLIDRLHSTEGGAEGVVHRLSRLLPARGFDCSVATFWAGDDVKAQFARPVHVLPFSKPFYWTALKNAWTFAQLLRSRRVDILHTFFPVSDIWGGIVARLAGCPILISGRRDMGILRARKHRLPYRLANSLFTQVHAVSEKVREFCIHEDGLSPEKVITVPNGVDLASIDSCQPADRRREFGVGQESPVIVTVANLRPVKGIDILVRAASLVCRQFPDATFAVIGEAHEGSYLPDLQALAKNLGVMQNVHFFGRRTDVCALLKASDLFCLPSRSEGMSNALLEAMACHLPCVTTDVGGNPEVMIHDRTGFLVPPENPEALAERIIAVLQSPDRERLGHEGRQVVEAKFTLERMIDRLSSLYESLLEDRGLHSPIRCERSVEPMCTASPVKAITTVAS